MHACFTHSSSKGLHYIITNTPTQSELRLKPIKPTSFEVGPLKYHISNIKVQKLGWWKKRKGKKKHKQKTQGSCARAGLTEMVGVEKEPLSLFHMTKRSWVRLPCREQKDQELGLQRGQARPGRECWQLSKSYTLKTRASETCSTKLLHSHRAKFFLKIYTIHPSIHLLPCIQDRVVGAAA